MAEQSGNTIVVRVGKLKKSKKQIRALKKGEGKLAEKINAAIHEAHPALTEEHEVLPVVIVVREKEKKKKKKGRGHGMFRLFDI